MLMRVPQDKALGYTAALIACGIVAALIVGAATSALTPRSALLGNVGGLGGVIGGSSGDGSSVKIALPGTGITIDTGKAEEAARRMEAAQAKGDTKAAEKPWAR
ncbi:MAG: hypothetical protein HC858_02315 [Brachymonas sp.]|nr:hypothetical protein [Brachymonas sp.]